MREAKTTMRQTNSSTDKMIKSMQMADNYCRRQKIYSTADDRNPTEDKNGVVPRHLPIFCIAANF